jgi:hypothetical protein
MIKWTWTGVMVLLATASWAEAPRGKAELTLNGNTMTIDYGRPSLQGRDMLGQAPPGTVWRLGADAATRMDVSGTATFGPMVIRPGSYSLFMKRTGKDTWALLVNRQTGQWGTEHDPNQDIFAIPLKWEKQESSTEELTIELTQEKAETGILSVRWGRDVLRQRFRLVPAS